MADKLMNLQAEMVDAIMGYNFDTTGFQVVAADHLVFKEIATARKNCFLPLSLS